MSSSFLIPSILPGNLTIKGNLDVEGTTSIVSIATSGAITIDLDNTEAFLVRKDGDAGDVFIVDTTNSQAKIANGSNVTPSLAFTGTSSNTGLYLEAIDTIGFTANGSKRMNIGTATIQINPGQFTTCDFDVFGDNVAIIAADSATDTLVLNAQLDEATGNETALTLNYTANKATSGDNTGFLINFTDTNSPGDAYVVDFKVDGTSRFFIESNGQTSIVTTEISTINEVAFVSDFMLGGDVGGTAALKAKVTGFSTGGTSGNSTYGLEIDLTGSPNDTDHEYRGIQMNAFSAAAGSGEATGLLIGQNYTTAIELESGSFIFAEYNGLIQTVQESAGAGPNLTLQTADGVTSGQGGDIIVTLGSGAGGSDDGIFIIGNSTGISLQNKHSFQVLGTAAADSGMILGRWSADSAEPRLDFVKSRNATIGSNTIVQNNDTLGGVRFYADDGTDFATVCAVYEVEVDDASPATNDIGAAHVWYSLPGGGDTTVNEVMRIGADGILDVSTNSLKIKKSTANVSDPPTDAELDSAFGSPSTLGSGFIGLVDDNDAGADGDVWLCATTGTDGEWFYLSMTKAV